MRRFKVLNLILIITIFFLAGEIITNNSSDNFITGQSIYTGDQIQPTCSYYNGLEVKQLPPERCCYEAILQLRCESFNYENYEIITNQTNSLLHNRLFKYSEKLTYINAILINSFGVLII